MMANIERVEARIQEIVQTVNGAQKQISDLNVEYQQLLGYRQAILDSKKEETSQKEAMDLFDEPGLLEG